MSSFLELAFFRLRIKFEDPRILDQVMIPSRTCPVCMEVEKESLADSDAAAGKPVADEGASGHCFNSSLFVIATGVKAHPQGSSLSLTSDLPIYSKNPILTTLSW